MARYLMRAEFVLQVLGLMRSGNVRHLQPCTPGEAGEGVRVALAFSGLLPAATSRNFCD